MEQRLTSYQTHYRSYRERIFTGQMTKPTVSSMEGRQVQRIRLQSDQVYLTALTVIQHLYSMKQKHTTRRHFRCITGL